ncbi:MAG TPA: hypothetical protein VM490_12880 [Armatimonadaceae bacterium]|nr:hypothetical protein [Armatimonadaceae bacterium]
MSNAGDGHTHVLATDADYYLTGPQQAAPPDGRFPAGTHVRIVEDEGSYVRVEAQNGVVAYVAADAVSPLDDSE